MMRGIPYYLVPLLNMNTLFQGDRPNDGFVW